MYPFIHSFIHLFIHAFIRSVLIIHTRWPHQLTTAFSEDRVKILAINENLSNKLYLMIDEIRKKAGDRAVEAD